MIESIILPTLLLSEHSLHEQWHKTQKENLMHFDRLTDNVNIFLGSVNLNPFVCWTPSDWLLYFISIYFLWPKLSDDKK